MTQSYTVLSTDNRAVNLLAQQAVAYLINLNGLEIIAGLNFRRVRDDLAKRELLTPAFRDRLNTAFRQEMKHATIVRRMLRALGVDDKASLTQRMRWLNDMLLMSLSSFPAEQHAYICIHLNHLIEKRLADEGNVETYRALREVAKTVAAPSERAALLEAATDFYHTVALEEPEHVTLDAEALEIYEHVYPALDMDAAMRAIRSRTFPFHSVIRTKQRLLKGAAARAHQHQKLEVA
jgi:hypothetical protein